MENLRTLKLALLIVLVVFFITPAVSSAYKIPIHRDLTYETFQTYNKLFNKNFTSQEIAKAIQGSADEDDGTRPLRHFYDPVNVKGLFDWTASRDWAQDTEKQSKYGKNTKQNDKYFSNPDDYSWDRAVYEYAHGDKDRAIETLGHILHLIQDSTVPPHVRNDDHLSKNGSGDISLYEEFTISQKIPKLDISILDIPNFTKLDAYFYNTAWFTNSNFLSKGTVFSGYAKPKRSELKLIRSVKDGKGQYFGVKKDNRIVRIKRTKDWRKNSYNEDYFLQDKNNLILTDYWNTLSQQAVINGVGVINLFFSDVEKEKKTLSLKKKNKSKAEKRLARLLPTGFAYSKALYGSSLTADDVRDLLGENTASVASVKLPEVAPPKLENKEVVVSTPTPVQREPFVKEVKPVVVVVKEEKAELVLEVTAPRIVVLKPRLKMDK